MAASYKLFQTLLVAAILALLVTPAIAEEKESHKKQFLLLGGGGENEKPRTIFDESLSSILDFLDQSKSEYRYQLVYDGFNQSLKDITKTRGYPRADVNIKNINDSLDDLINQIKEKKLINGGQILVYIQSHGAPSSAKEKTHSIAIWQKKPDDESSPSDEDANVYSLDKLQSLRDVASKAGVQLGIVDISCFSGNSLSLADDNTCVIAASRSDLTSTSIFDKNFSKQMKKGKSLEEIFLNTRNGPRGSVFGFNVPQISSPEGKEISKILEKLAGYLVPDTDFISRIDRLEQDSCETNGLGTLAELDLVFQKLRKIALVSEPSIVELEKATRKYAELYKKANSRLLELKKVGEQPVTYSHPDGQVLWKWRDLRNTSGTVNKYVLDAAEWDINRLKLLLEKAKVKGEKEERIRELIPVFESQLREAEQDRKQIEDVIASSEFTQYREDSRLFLSDVSELNKQAYLIYDAEKNVYDQLYRSLKKGGKNPCREFVL